MTINGYLAKSSVVAALGVVVVVVDGPARATKKCLVNVDVELRATRANAIVRRRLEGLGPMTTLAVKAEEHGLLPPLYTTGRGCVDSSFSWQVVASWTLPVIFTLPPQRPSSEGEAAAAMTRARVGPEVDRAVTAPRAGKRHARPAPKTSLRLKPGPSIVRRLLKPP